MKAASAITPPVPAAPKKAPAAKRAPTTRTMTGNVITKYSAAGYKTLPMPTRALMDIIAVKHDIIHYIRVFPTDAEPPIAIKNIFIQNAMSNQAIPIYVTNGPDGNFIYTDINLINEVKL